MPQFVPDGRPTYTQGLTMAGLSVIIATAIHFALVLGAETARPLLLSGDKTTLVRRALAVGMFGVAIWFLSKAFA